MSTASLASLTPAAAKSKAGNSNYKQTCYLTFNPVGSSPAMTEARAARAGVTKEDIKNLYISTEGITLLRTYMAANPTKAIIDAVNDIRKVHKADAPTVAMIPAFQKIVDAALNGTTRAGGSQVKDKAAQADAKAAAISKLGLSGVLKVGEAGSNGRVTIQTADAPAADAPAEAPAPAPQAEVKVETPKAEGKGDKSKSK